jgi:4'-phosphopantetheinyl transferase
VRHYILAQLPQHLALSDSEVQAWQMKLDFQNLPYAMAYETLSPAECERAQRFHFEQDRQRFVLTRAVLRILLGKYCGCVSQDVCFSYLAHGKPVIDNDGIQFNVSHTHELAVLAFAATVPVGIDIEYLQRELDYQQLAKRYFSPEEIKAMEAAAEDNHKRIFLELWTRKEALLKATGEGISRTLNQLDVTNQILSYQPKGAASGATESNWNFHALSLDANYVGSLVVGGRQLVVSQLEIALSEI